MDIQNLNEAWNGHTGLEVETFVKQQLRALIQEKVGHGVFANGTLSFYQNDESQEALFSIPLDGQVYSITIATNPATDFVVLTGDTAKMLTITPSTRAGAIGESLVDFAEDYTLSISVDTGNGSFVERLSNVEILNGSSYIVNVRNWLSTGSNRIKITVEGSDSHQTKSTILRATLTTLSLSVSPTWWRPWTEGSNFGVDGINIAGSMSKTLYVRIDNGTTVTRTFRASENYVTQTYTLTFTAEELASLNLSTGLHSVEVWAEGNDVSTPIVEYTSMYVETADAETAQMVVFNEMSVEVSNFTNSTPLHFATYGVSTATLSAVITDGTASETVVDGMTMVVENGVSYGFPVSLEFDTEEREGVTLTMTVAAGPATNSAVFAVDNSAAYLATAGAKLYINAAARSNSGSNKNTLINQVDGTTIASTFSGFSWMTDGWTTDKQNRRALCLMAGTSVTSSAVKLPSMDGDFTFEVNYRVSVIADFDTPVLSLMNTAEYNPATSRGIIVFPTKVIVLTDGKRSFVSQTVNIDEDTDVHLMVVCQHNYNSSGQNLFMVYINGIAQAVFDFAGTDSMGTCTLQMGQASSDLYVRQMRIYESALQPTNVLDNYLNALSDGEMRAAIREKNNILDATLVDYAMVKQAGFNTMVIEVTSGDLPSIKHSSTEVKNYSNVAFEFADHPEWNFWVENAPLDGQGTTSMRYYRWNLRWKMSDDCVWHYADGTTSTGKSGYFDGGYNGHPKTERITAKKNYASSMQGHKMGATSMYDDLYAAVGLKNEMPDNKLRVAVYQYPFMGFRKYVDGNKEEYEFIGLYTAGPDKGCKKTFGYDKSTYPMGLSLEGPNHDPLGTRFLHPWINVTYNNNEETLMFGGEEGWDCDFIAGPKSDKEASSSDIAAVLARYESEWKPAYEHVYYNSQYIASFTEVGSTLTQINTSAQSVSDFRSGFTGGMKNSLLQLYDDSYNLYYYSNASKQYEQIPNFNLLTDLGLAGSPTTAQIKEARATRFKTDMGKYFSVGSTLFHRAFTILIGATDNDAKNMYPFKHTALNTSTTSVSNGDKWMWRQDDLDSIMATDNNGAPTKSYSVEPLDETSEHVQIFQGADSALWKLVDVCYQDEVKDMMQSIVSNAVAMSGIAGNTTHEKMFNVFSKYFWDNTARYFALLAYAEDLKYSYLQPWLENPATTYNGVLPLTQALGNQLVTEQLWVRRRIAYVFSKYSIGGFAGSSGEYGNIEFTTTQTFTFHIKPAIDLYPIANRGGGSNDEKGDRTSAGNTCTLSVISSGATTIYLHGMDWISDVGDLCGLTLTSRGAGQAEIPFSVVSSRLRELKVGDAVASNVSFNASSLSVSAPALESIDARNTSTVTNEIDLRNMPRLKTALFEGSGAYGLLLPIGGKVTTVSFPSGVRTILLHSLPVLATSGVTIPSSEHVQHFYFENCPNINGLALLLDIYQSSHSVRYVTVKWEGEQLITDAQASTLSLFAAAVLADSTSYGYATYSDSGVSHGAGVPIIGGALGSIRVETIDREDKELIESVFGVTINATNVIDYIKFEDDRVAEICAYNWGDTALMPNGATLYTGEIDCEAGTEASSDYLFACVTAYAAHKSSGVAGVEGSSNDIPAVTAHTEQFTIEVEGEHITGIKVIQAASNTSTLVTLADSAAETNPFSQSGNKYTVLVTTTNACQYLLVKVTTDADEVVSYNIITASAVHRHPVGMSKDQAALVTSLQSNNNTATTSRFNHNALVRRFSELVYFTQVTTLGQGCFNNATSLEYAHLEHITNILSGNNPTSTTTFGGTAQIEIYLPNIERVGAYPFTTNSYSPFNTKLRKIILGASLTTISRYTFRALSGGAPKIIIYATTPPTTSEGTAIDRYQMAGCYFYVPDESYEDYMSASQWANYANAGAIKRMSDLTE